MKVWAGRSSISITCYGSEEGLPILARVMHHPVCPTVAFVCANLEHSGVILGEVETFLHNLD
jgi:hypothetical protein